MMLLIYDTYDTWGKKVSTTGSLAGTLGLFQPFRYRGYVYDWETGFYYLQSRYYDPTTGRFISADVLLSTGQGVLGHNAYAYCGDNPVNRTDSEGQFWNIIAAVVVVAVSTVVSAISSGISEAASGGSFWAGAAGGAVSGAISAIPAAVAVATGGLSAPAMIGLSSLYGGIGASAGYAVTQLVKGEQIDPVHLINKAAGGAVGGAISGAIGVGTDGLAQATCIDDVVTSGVGTFVSTIFGDGANISFSAIGRIIDNSVWRVKE